LSGVIMNSKLSIFLFVAGILGGCAVLKVLIDAAVDKYIFGENCKDFSRNLLLFYHKRSSISK